MAGEEDMGDVMVEEKGEEEELRVQSPVVVRVLTQKAAVPRAPRRQRAR